MLRSYLLLFFCTCLIGKTLTAQKGKPSRTNKADTSIYYAGFENKRAFIEEQLFYNVSKTRTVINKLLYPGSHLTLAEIENRNWSNLSPKTPIGPSILLKTDSADVFDLFVEGFYLRQSAIKKGIDKNAAKEILTALESIIQPLAAGVGNAGSKFISGQDKYFNIEPGLRMLEKDKIGKSKNGGYLNWMVLDSTLSFDKNGEMGFLKLGEPGKMNQLSKSNIKIKKSGYLLVFLSNEYNSNVYFDNLVLKHYKPNLLTSSLASYIITEDEFNITTEANINLIIEN